MNIERTLAIIKPDAVEQRHVGEILSIIENNGLRVLAMKMKHLTPAQVEAFYYEHNDKYFFHLLCEMMMDGPVVIMALQGESACSRWRQLIGATDPVKAEAGTIRQLFGENISHNGVHGSDGPESADFETAFFFSRSELL